MWSGPNADPAISAICSTSPRQQSSKNRAAYCGSVRIAGPPATTRTAGFAVRAYAARCSMRSKAAVMPVSTSMSGQPSTALSSSGPLDCSSQSRTSLRSRAKAPARNGGPIAFSTVVGRRVGLRASSRNALTMRTRFFADWFGSDCMVGEGAFRCGWWPPSRASVHHVWLPPASGRSRAEARQPARGRVPVRCRHRRAAGQRAAACDLAEVARARRGRRRAEQERRLAGQRVDAEEGGLGVFALSPGRLQPLLRDGVELMLAGSPTSARAMKSPASDDAPTPTQPTRIGPYRILDTLGEGGMGIVYLAEQQEPVKRRVALKVIKLGMDSKAVLARFDAERHALALMEHSAVARIYDAGTTERGQPWFAMELVKGIPITTYCDENELSVEQRLALFRIVCSGIQHAHLRGVMHRDIKPSNVLVTLQDGEPAAKIIDFGLAKAVDHRLVEATLFTEQGQVIGTPEIGRASCRERG